MPPNYLRRTLLLASLAAATGVHALAEKQLSFPRDHGAHKDFRTEWWYITGYATSGEREFGFQITFFRSRIDATQGMTSGFAAKQIIFAHAAVTDVQGKKLWHDQRIARSSGTPGLDAATASESDTAIRLRDWSLQRDTVRAGPDAAQSSRYSALIAGSDFSLALQLSETQALLLQGDQGLSRKGPEPRQASYYYSQPQLGVRGHIVLQGKRFEVSEAGTGAEREARPPAVPSQAAWLDHEWSQELLHPSAVGWDWIGMNLIDGSALTAFRLRDASGGTVWAGGSFRPRPGGHGVPRPPTSFKPGEVSFSPARLWQSPQSQTRYPVEWAVQTPAGSYTVRAVIDGQELDSRHSTGTIYWEGLSDLFDSLGRHVGRGYLEMTGYAEPFRM